METQINGKQVKIDTAEKFCYDGVEASKLKELNETLYNEVQKQVVFYIENKEKVDEEKRQAKKEACMEKQKIAVTLFKASVIQACPELKDYELIYQEPTGNSWSNMDMMSIRLGTIYVSVKYDDKVFSSSSWSHHHTTSKPYCVETDYKTTRYGSLATALKKAIEKIKELKAERDRKTTEANTKASQETAMQLFAASNGFEFNKDWHSYNCHGRHSNGGYYTYSMKKGNITARIQYDTKTDTVIITSYTVHKGSGISLEVLKGVQ